MRDSSAPFEFKFVWVNEYGRATNIVRRKGRFEGETLVLDGLQFHINQVAQTNIAKEYLNIVIATGNAEQPFATYPMATSTAKLTAEIKAWIDRARSRLFADHHRRELESKGQGESYRDAVCPNCGVTLILTKLEESPQVYCHFCDSLATIDRSLDPNLEECRLRICEVCGYYSKVEMYTILYFAHCFIAFWSWSHRTFRCPPCMRGEAWKMFFGNFVFLLGLPTAIIQLIRAYGGSSPRGRYRGLDVANMKARKGDLHGAAEHYKRILDTVEVSAGIRYNLGMALVKSSERELAEGAFEMAIRDCATYEPAYTQLRLLYKMSRKANELQALEAKWLLQDPETAASTSPSPVSEAKAVPFQPLAIVDCPWCGTTVAPTPQNECPSCRRSLSR